MNITSFTFFDKYCLTIHTFSLPRNIFSKLSYNGTFYYHITVHYIWNIK